MVGTKLALFSAILMRRLVTSMSVAGGGMLKAVLVAEIEIGMLRSWHFRAVTAVARARRSVDLNMVSVCLNLASFESKLMLRLMMENEKSPMLQ